MFSSSRGDEARRALADELEAFTHAAITRMERGDKTAAHLATEDMCVVMIKSIPLIIAALRADPVRAVEEMETELHLALREAEPTIMLTTVSDGPAIELIIDERQAAIRVYEALESVVGRALDQGKGQGGGDG